MSPSPSPLLTPPAARRHASPPPPPRPADAAGCALHAWPADLQSRRDSHRAPPKAACEPQDRPSNQIKSNQIVPPPHNPPVPAPVPPPRTSPLYPLPYPPPTSEVRGVEGGGGATSCRIGCGHEGLRDGRVVDAPEQGTRMHHHSTESDTTNAPKMRARHAGKSYKCATRLVVIDTRHYYAVWVWCYFGYGPVQTLCTTRNTPPIAVLLSIFFPKHHGQALPNSEGEAADVREIIG